METLLRISASAVNNLHDFIIFLSSYLGLHLSDKDLHFWVIGLIGLAVFILSDILFRFLSKWSVSAISFIYTMTLLIVIVFAVEIEQGITGRGNMDFHDIASGIWGFFVLFGCYMIFRWAVCSAEKSFKKKPYYTEEKGQKEASTGTRDRP